MSFFKDVSNAELSVLQALWARGERRIRDLADELYPAGGAAHYATVQRLLDRLEEKGFVTRDRTGRAHVFRPAVGRGDFLGHRLRDLADRLCSGAHAPIVSQLVRSQVLSAKERSELRRLLDEMDDQAEDAS